MRPLLLAALLAAAMASPAQAQDEAGAGITVTVGAPVLVGCRVALFTAYSVEQFPGTTASGLRTPGNAGWIVAHGRNGQEGLPFGTLVWIDGLGLRSVQDRGGGLSAGHFDVLLATTAEARRFGVQRLEVCEVVP